MKREAFHRHCKRHLGVSPMQFRRLQRIARAKHALAKSMPVADVAALCGFADQAHFARWFKPLRRSPSQATGFAGGIRLFQHLSQGEACVDDLFGCVVQAAESLSRIIRGQRFQMRA